MKYTSVTQQTRYMIMYSVIYFLLQNLHELGNAHIAYHSSSVFTLSFVFISKTIRSMDKTFFPPEAFSIKKYLVSYI